MIDLSFLTEEEQETIRAVLKRDAELKKAEEHRVQNLQKTVSDRSQLRYLTGDWFYETKQLRHQDRIHGSDIIRASMKHTHKPLTILELSHILPERSSFVSSENKDVFVPPVLCGLIQEPDIHLISEGYQIHSPRETEHDTPKTALQSPTKRKNPFNCNLPCEEKDGQLLDGAADQTHAQNEETALSPDSHISSVTDFKENSNDNVVTQDASVSIQMPESRAIGTNSPDSFAKVDGSSDRQTGSADLQAVIENTSASESTQSLFFHKVPQSPVSLATETWTANKQLSFSSDDQRAVEGLDGKQLGELPSEVETASGLESVSCTNAGTQRPLLQQSQADAQEDELNCKNQENFQDDEAGPHQIVYDVSEQCLSEPQIPGASSLVSAVKEPAQLETEVSEDSVRPNVYSLEAPSYAKPSPGCSSKRSSHVRSQKYKQKLLGLFRREKGKPSQVQSPQKKRLISQQKGYRSAAETTGDKSKSAQITEVRSITLTALQKTPFKETLISSDADPWQEGSVSQAQFPKTVSDLKEFGVTEKRDFDISLAIEERKHEDTHCQTEIEASQGLQTNSDVRNINNNVLPQKESTLEDSAGKSQLTQFSPQTDHKMFVDLSKDDGTYRAHPVFVYDEMNDSLAGSVTDLHISELQDESVTCPVPPVSFITQKQEECIPVSLLTQSSSTFQSDRVDEISNKEVSPQSDQRISPENRKKSEKEAQLNQTESKPFVVTSSQMTDRPDLGSFDNSVDTKLPCHQDTESQERCLSPSKSPRPKDKDDKVKWSPSKTYHPKVLPRESSSGKGSRLEGSPLKTFPIEIDPKAKGVEEQQGNLTPVPRQKKSPSHVTKQAAQTDTKDNTSSLLLLHPADGGTCFSHVNTRRRSNTSTSPHSDSGNEVENFPPLHRSFIPKDKQHYLGPTERAHSPPFHHDKAESDAGHGPQSALVDFLGNQSDNPTERNSDRISSWNVQSKDETASQDATTRSWSLSRANSGSYGERSSPILATLKRLASRSKSSSKSLENLTSQTASPVSNSESMKCSISVPFLQQEEVKQEETVRESSFETSLGRRRNNSNSLSNLTLSSGMASMSSVSSSISSLYPAEFGDIEVQGSIQFAVNYIQKLGEFQIFVVLVRGLAVADTKKNRSDPYVKCYLLPDKRKLGKRKTTVKKKTLNPTYNEVLGFKTKMEELRTHQLNISVWHNDTFGRNSFLGEVDLDLSQWDFSNTQINEYALKARVSEQISASSPSHLMDSRGQMRVALRFLTQTPHSKGTPRMETGEVQIWVKDCKNLPPVRGFIINPFVKCTVLPDMSSKSRQKTRVVKKTASPMFNHIMVYDGFRSEDLKEACVEITVWDHDRLKNHYIGGLRLGLGTGRSYGVEVVWMDSTTDEANLWQRMLQCDGDWVEDILPLRMLVTAKSMTK